MSPSSVSAPSPSTAQAAAPTTALELAVHEAGSGPLSILFLHGFGEGSYVWSLFAHRLAPGIRRLSPDFRGHGDSPWSADGTYSTAAHVGDVQQLLRDRTGGRLVLVGHSMGAGVALHIAARLPERVCRLVLVDYGLESNPAFRERLLRQFDESLRAFDSVDEYREYLMQGRPLLSDEAAALVASRALRTDAGGRLRIKCDPRLREMSLERDIHATHRCMQAVRCPTLLVRGAGSAAVSRAQVEDMARQFVDARVEEVPAAGHGVMLDNPAGFARAVLSVCGELGP